jgi:outer membrane protein assembly factor BamB
MNTRTNRLIVGFCSAMLTVFTAYGTSYYFPKFGTPIVTDKFLVFSGPGWKSNRIICISRETGKKAWEIKEEKAVLQPGFMMAGDLIITKGADVFSCRLKNGNTTELYSTGYERCELSPHRRPLVIIEGERGNAEFLSLVDLRKGKKLWEVQNLRHIVAETNGVLLCQYAERKSQGAGGYSYINQRLTAISEVDGNVLWNYPQPKECYSAEGVAIGDYFVVDLAGTIHCLNQKTGTAVKTLQIQENPYVSISLASRDGAVLVWTQEGGDVFSGHVVYSVSVPQLIKSKLTKTDWYSAVSQTYGDVVIGRTIGRMDTYNIKTGEKLWQGGQWNWNGVHDGWIYYSTMEANGTHTSVNMIEVTSGKSRKLYEEVLPEEYQWTPKKRTKATTFDDDIKIEIKENQDDSNQAPEDTARELADPQR